MCHFIFYFQNLPEEVIVNILQYIPVIELLLSVRKVSQRLWDIIENNGSLFIHIIFDDSYIIDEDILMAITKHARYIKTFQMAYQTFTMDSCRFNTMLSSLEYAKSLTTLDISECPVSDISFVQSLTSLRCLNVSCTEISNGQLKYISLPKLTDLYLSFNNLYL